jgi:hydroxymethylbilane synthase
VKLRVATRGSPLALWQTREVGRLLRSAAGVEVEEIVVQTTGDRRQDVPIHEMGGQGVFVKEVQAAVLEGRADLAVHSAKDLPPRTAPGLALAAVPVRGDVRDALVGGSLDDLPAGAVVATGSVRRRAQLAWLRPDLSFVGLRGNIASRLAAVGRVEGAGPGTAGQIDAVVVAAAALERLDRIGEAAEIFSPARLLPQVGQGALAVEAREDDRSVREVLAGIEDPSARAQVDAERAFLDSLGGGCEAPVGALATGGRDRLALEGLLASGDGRLVLRRSRSGPGSDPVALGRALAAELLAAAGPPETAP